MKKMFPSAALLLLLAAVNGCFTTAYAQGTAFTYQGRLNASGAVANGSFDIAFTLYTTNVTGTAIAGPVTKTAVVVTNGLFTTTVDFGSGAFLGTSNWLALAVSTNGANSFSILSPRQQVTPTPYALYSATANSANFAASATTASTAGSAASVPASGIGAGTANINISGNAATATSASASASAVNANYATTAGSATTATSAGFATNSLFSGTATNALNFTGAISDAQLSTNIVRLNGTNLFTGTNTFANTVIATNPANQINGTFTGSGAGLTGLSSVSLAAGSITAAMLAPDAVTMLGTPGSGPTNAVNVSTNGLVGIGTSNGVPTAGLQIASGATQTILPVVYEVQNGNSGYTNLGGASSSAVNSNLLAIGASYGVTLVNLANPSAPALQAQIVNGTGGFTNISGVYGLAWAGSNLVAGAVDSNAVTIIGCTNPASPVKLAELRNGVGGWNYLSEVYGVAVSGNLLAIAALNSSAVTLADISNPAAPVLRSAMVNGTYGFTNINGAISVALSGNLLAIGAFSSSAVTLVNVANPTNPQKLAELVNGVGGFTNLDTIYSVALSGNLLAIAANGSGAVTLVDVSNPASPVLKAQLVNGVGGYSLNSASSVAFSGNRLAISGIGTVTLVDVSNPASPVLLATATDGLNGADYLYGANGVAFAGTNLVACGQNDNGLTLLGIGTQAVGLDSANWVGIGTTHPQAALDVVGNMLVENATLFDVSAVRVALGVNANASGNDSTALGPYATASSYDSTALGYGSTASGGSSTALGYGSTASANQSTALGSFATASGFDSTALGNNVTASGQYSTALGDYTTASGSFATAMGYYSQATNTGCLVWSDESTYPAASSTTDNSLTFRAAGGYRLFSNSGMSAGVSLAPGGTAWATISDQNAKKNFQAINGEEVLNKLAAVPVEQWNYKWEKDSDVPNIGPMAQAFKKAFYPGRDDKSITTLEFDGVELAAIQGLNQKMEEKDAKIQKQDAEIAELKQRLDALEKLILNQKPN